MMCATYASTDKNKASPMTDPARSSEEQQRITKAEIDQLQRENVRVVAQLKEVMKMNTHWQRYDSQREEYVLKLTRTNQELQDKVSDLQRQLEELSNAKKSEIKRQKPKLEDRNRKDDNGEADDDSLPQELKASASLPEEEVVALAEHIANLKDRILELEKARESRKKEDDDQLALLREQVNVCIEDFKQERRDRERIHGDNEKLRERLAKAEQDIMRKDEQLYLYQEQIEQLQERRRLRPLSKPPAKNGYDEPCCYPEDRPYRHRTQVQTRQIYRHPLHLGDDLTDLPRNVEVDGVPDDPKSFDQFDGLETETLMNGEKEEEPLQCPICLTPFGINKHDDLLDHIDTCLE